jgi:hypothetical protein
VLDKEKRLIQWIQSEYGHIWLLFSKGRVEIKNETMKSDKEIQEFINEHMLKKAETLKTISLEMAYLEHMKELVPIQIKEKDETGCEFTFRSFSTLFFIQNETFYIKINDQLLDVNVLFTDVIKKEIKKCTV